MPVNYTISESLAVRTVAEETFILEREKNTLHTFNALGGTVWRLLMAGRTCDEIVKAIMDEFEVEHSEAEADFLAFLNRCEQERLVKISP